MACDVRSRQREGGSCSGNVRRCRIHEENPGALGFGRCRKKQAKCPARALSGALKMTLTTVIAGHGMHGIL